MQPQQPNPYPQPNPSPPQQDFPAPSQEPLHPSHYDFIVNPGGAPKGSGTKLSLGGGSMVKKLILVLVGIFVLLIIFVVIKGSLGGSSSNLPALTAVAQQQQELIHIVTNANSNTQQQNSLSVTDQNFSTTAQLAISSEQSQLLAYMKSNGHKLTAKQLALGVSTNVDNELNAAVAASTFSQAYSQVMQQQLATYQQQLNKAYSLTTGTKGRALLKSDYNSAQLLFEQLSSPAS